MFHLFTFDEYYPGGGMEDYRGSFPTVEEAQAAFVLENRPFGNIAGSAPDGSLAFLWNGQWRNGKVEWTNPVRTGHAEPK